MANQPKGHLNHFPTDFPAAEAMIVVNGIRGIDDGHTLRDRIEAAWWVTGFGASMTPERHPVMEAGAAPLSDSELANHLESAAGKGDGMKALPWAKILAAMIVLIQKLLTQ